MVFKLRPKYLEFTVSLIRGVIDNASIADDAVKASTVDTH